MSGCTVQRLEAPGLTFLKVSGTIDETFSATELAQQIRADTILHLGKVTRFSSFGVREWVRLMKDLRGRVKHCLLVECSPAVVNQLNVVVDFAAGAHVKSVQLPYVCQDDEMDQLVVADVDSQREALLAGRLPEVLCPKCRKPMVFDDLPSSFLAFLRDAAPPEPNSAMAAFIASFEQAAPKLVEGAAASTRAPAAVASPPMSSSAPLFGGVAAGPAGGRSPAVRWAAAVAALVAVAAVGWMMRGTQTPTQVQPPPPDPVAHQAEPEKPKPRSLSPEEVLEFTLLLNSERFLEAEGKLKTLQALLTEESHQKTAAQIQSSRISAMETHMQKAQALTAKRPPDYQGAREQLDLAISAGGESDRSLHQRLMLERRAYNCPAVIATAEALAERFPGSTYQKAATDAKKACLAQQPIQAGELRKILATIQTDLDGCLKARAEGQGAIELFWMVTPGGEPQQVTCTTPSLAESPLCQCLKEQVRRVRFSERPGTQHRRASYKFGT